MLKSGILHDYDLMANNEKSAQRADFICIICGASPPTYQWSDYSGEAMCIKCGCPYQLKWGSEAQKEEDNYPYLNLNPDLVPIVRAYWEETKQWTCFGTMLDGQPGAAEFNAWYKKNYPDAEEANGDG